MEVSLLAIISLAKFSLIFSIISPLLSVIHFEISEKSSAVASSWKLTTYCLRADSVEMASAETASDALASCAETKIDEDNSPRMAAKRTRSRFIVRAQLSVNPLKWPR